MAKYTAIPPNTLDFTVCLNWQQKPGTFIISYVDPNAVGPNSPRAIFQSYTSQRKALAAVKKFLFRQLAAVLFIAEGFQIYYYVTDEPPA